MPAHITVESGITAGSVHVIEKPVMRIGSAAKADICIPSQGFADHALTLEFRGGAYHVHNRDSRPVTVGRTELPAGESMHWSAGQRLKTFEGTCLVLHVGDDAAPRPRSERQPLIQETEVVDDVSADLPEADGTDARGKPLRTKEMCIIVGCALAGLLMLVGGPVSAPQEDLGHEKGFDSSLRAGTPRECRGGLYRIEPERPGRREPAARVAALRVPANRHRPDAGRQQHAYDASAHPVNSTHLAAGRPRREDSTRTRAPASSRAARRM